MYKKIEIKIKLIKTILSDFRDAKQVKRVIQTQLFNQLFLYDKNAFITKIINSCVFTGRTNSVSRIFRISRIEIRKQASNNDLNGLRTSSW